MTQEDKMKLRFMGWLSIGVVIIAFNLIIVSVSMLDWLGIANWSFVPSIANGIVSASSILMAVAFFTINTFFADKERKNESSGRLPKKLFYIIALFTLLMGEVFLGYLAVSLNALPFALCFFMTAFFLQCGVIYDIWVDSI